MRAAVALVAAAVLLLAVTLAAAQTPHPIPTPAVSYYTSRVDHFNDAVQTTFQQKILTCTEFWQHKPGQTPGPVIFYTGNEGKTKNRRRTHG
jgi:hypothetical protein